MKQIARTGVFCCVTSLALLCCAGCLNSLSYWTPSGWLAGYESAEQHASKTGRPLLIYYREVDHEKDREMDDAMDSSLVERLSTNYVRCRLFRSYEPQRRYVAQFGVDRTPALIVVHRDGTYHSHVGLMSSAEVASFLDSARPPGKQPRLDPYLPRKPEYIWQNRIDEAERMAQRVQRPTLIVFHRTLTSDWETVEELLLRKEVYARFAGLVHCRVGVLNPWANAHITRFGALRLPALVLLLTDGTFEVLETPTSYEGVVRFADATLNPVPATENEVAAGGP
jgi:hypothetical protein